MGAITITVVTILGVLLIVVLKQLFKKQPAKPVEDLANLKITDARVGDNVSIAGAGKDFSDLDFAVDRHSRYQAGSREWTELSGQAGERRVYLEIVDQDELEVRVSEPDKLTLEDLGVSEDDLATMDERQNPADYFEFDGHNWAFRFSRELRFSRDGQGGGHGIYGWEFAEQEGKRVLFIRKPEGEPFAATMFTRVNPADVTVYRGA